MKIDLKVIQAQVEQSRALLRIAEDDLAKSVFYAPFDGFVTVKLKPEISSFIGDITSSSPPIATTKAETTVCVRDGYTAVIGGLVTRTDSERENGLPGLRKVPILKRLAGGQSKTWQQQEIVVLLTPTIVPSGAQWPREGADLANPLNVPWKKKPERLDR